MRICWGAAIAATLCSGIASAQQPAPVVATAEGRLAGTAEAGVDRFLGVPFAAAPVGAFRWRAPQPAPRWRGIRSAVAPSPICVQDSANNPLTPGYTPAQSEDCLYLNIYKPAGKAARRLPVMVWVHGGAFIMGAGGMPDYDGSALARRGAIVVTLNYRLGRFGTFAHPALSAEQAGGPVANYGLMDVIAALRWVRANITGFGGDSGNVTLFGESAGASTVNFLMTSPVARGLFHKAISQSGGASSGLKSLSTAEQEGKSWADGKGAADAATLRALPTAAVLDAPVRAPVFPVVDGRILLGSTSDVFASTAAPIPYLVGANDQEESLMRWLPGAGQALIDNLGPRADAVIAAYATPGEDRAVSVSRMWGENAMTLPARTRARQQATRGEPVWLYRFAYVPEALRRTISGAGHDHEMQFVFGVPAARSRAGWSARDAEMAKLVGDYWVAFARSGNPNHPGAPEWPRFTPSADRLLQLDADGAHAVNDFGKQRLDLLEAATTRR